MVTNSKNTIVTILKVGALFLLSSFIFSAISSDFSSLILVESILFILFFFRPSRVLSAAGSGLQYPLVSIVVPMRNEEKNVKGCIASLTSLQYPNLEIIIGNDASVDNTSLLLREAVSENKGNYPIRLIDIPPIQEGWTGKTWVVSQLVREAKGELILVTDADVRHAPESLMHTVSHFLETKSDLMARFPYPIISGVGEWSLLFLFFALRFASWFSLDFLMRRQTIAKEEYLLFTRACYRELGGYEAFKNDYPMILALFRAAFKKGKHVTILDDDTREITATAYDGFRGTLNGISERVNFRHVGVFSFLGIFIAISFAIDGLFKIISGFLTGDSLALLAGVASYLIFAGLFGVYLAMSRQPIFIALFGPLLGLSFLIVSLFAAVRAIFGVSLHWKGRTTQIQ